MYSNIFFNSKNLTVEKPPTEHNVASSRIAAQFNPASASNQAFGSTSKKMCNENRYKSKKSPEEILEMRRVFLGVERRPQCCFCGPNRVQEMTVCGIKQYSCTKCKFFMRETDFEREYCDCNLFPVVERCDKEHYLSCPKFKYTDRCPFKIMM